MKKIFFAIKEISAGIVLATTISFLLCIYAPIELFVSNQGDFWFDFGSLWPFALKLFGVFLIFQIIFFSVLRIISKTVYNIGIGLFFVVLAIFYVQGNFLVSTLPSLEGAKVDWSALSAGKISSIVLIAVVVIAVVLIYVFFKAVRFEKIVKYATLALCVMLTITFSTLCLTTKFTNKDRNILVTGHNDFTYSKDKNLIVFVVDAIDNREFLKAIRRNPEFSDTFDDFTYFGDTLAGYAYTKPSLPFIFSGKWYENDMPYEDYVAEALDNSPLIEKLRLENYKAGFYSQGSFDMPRQFSDVFENYIVATPDWKDQHSAFKTVIKMATIRYAPWQFKRFGYDVYDFAAKAMTAPSLDDFDVIKMNNIEFYGRIKDGNPIELIEEKCARIIHIEGAHIPFQYNKNVEIEADATYSTNMDACLTICDTYLKRLKESGVYDNTVVVIMGDHGFDITEKTFIGRMNPAFMVKGIDETNDEMKISNVPVSYENVAEVFVDLLDGEKTEQAFSKYTYPEGRRFLLFEYGKENIMEEYRINVKADDFKDMTPTGNIYKLKD